MPISTDLKPVRSISLPAARGIRAYWVGEAASLTGSAAHAVALPVIAAVELQATPGEVALLTSAALAPTVLLALPAGVVGDRMPKARLMVVTDLAAAVVVTAVPLSWAAGILTMPLVWVAALALGCLTVLHQAASIAIVPELVPPGLLHQANGQIGAVNAVARLLGTAGATAAIGVLGATRTLVLDAASYLISALCASRIPAPASPEPPAPPQLRMGAAIREALAYVRQDRVQRSQVVVTALDALASGFIATYLAYHLLTGVSAGSTGLGLVIGAAGIGSLPGALLAARLVDRFGAGAVMRTGYAVYLACGIPLLLAAPGPGWVLTLAAAACLQTAVGAVVGSTQRTIRQQLCPSNLQSRVQQITVCLVAGARLLAALLAGAIAHVAGVWAALLTGAVLGLLPLVLLWTSPAGWLTALPASKETS
jgi:MFS family permease